MLWGLSKIIILVFDFLFKVDSYCSWHRPWHFPHIPIRLLRDLGSSGTRARKFSLLCHKHYNQGVHISDSVLGITIIKVFTNSYYYYLCMHRYFCKLYTFGLSKKYKKSCESCTNAASI